MRDAASELVRKLWHYCNVLRDDGLSYPDYVEQLTYLLFLKMSDEQVDGPVARSLSWRSFAGLDARAMHRHYGDILSALGRSDGVLGLIFSNARNKIRDPAKLRLLVVDLIGQTQWIGLSADVKGDAYEGLLEKNARDTKSGAGQYFTPRPLIDAVVECVDPAPGDLVCDPACGTGGFLLAAHQHLLARSRRSTAAHRKRIASSIKGVELVEEVARLAAMNLLLHGITSPSAREVAISCADSLKEPPRKRVDVVLTNPPFGVKGSVTYSDGRRPQRADDDLTVVRPDFWVQTANKQLNFVQHVAALLRPAGRAAIVIPDNVLFETGAASIVRRRLLERFDVHTLLRLPSGLFYAQGVKANVLFFARPKERSALSKRRRISVYDLRSQGRFSLKTNPLHRSDLQEFVDLYLARSARRDETSGPVTAAHPRWRSFDIEDLLQTSACSLDLAWGRPGEVDSTPALARLEEISRLIAEDLQRALDHLSKASSAS